LNFPWKHRQSFKDPPLPITKHQLSLSPNPQTPPTIGPFQPLSQSVKSFILHLHVNQNGFSRNWHNTAVNWLIRPRKQEKSCARLETFDTKNIQRLTAIVCLCSNCFGVTNNPPTWLNIWIVWKTLPLIERMRVSLDSPGFFSVWLADKTAWEFYSFVCITVQLNSSADPLCWLVSETRLFALLLELFSCFALTNQFADCRTRLLSVNFSFIRVGIFDKNATTTHGVTAQSCRLELTFNHRRGGEDRPRGTVNEKLKLQSASTLFTFSRKKSRKKPTELRMNEQSRDHWKKCLLRDSNDGIYEHYAHRMLNVLRALSVETEKCSGRWIGRIFRWICKRQFRLSDSPSTCAHCLGWLARESSGDTRAKHWRRGTKHSICFGVSHQKICRWCKCWRVDLDNEFHRVFDIWRSPIFSSFNRNNVKLLSNLII
jgi:hypothetical protein